LRSYTILIFNRRGAPARIGLEFEDDEEAIHTVTEYGMGHLIELWHGDRLVRRFNAGDTHGKWPPDGFP
jgi:hypothetical protein